MKFRELNKPSANALSYASIFFPERIEPCGEASRLREQEKLFPPYEFLQIGRAEALRLHALQFLHDLRQDRRHCYFTGGTVKRSVTVRPRRS